MRICMREAGYHIVRHINESLFMLFMPKKKILGTIDRLIYSVLVKLVLLERKLLMTLY